jgi:hypothetical protein
MGWPERDIAQAAGFIAPPGFLPELRRTAHGRDGGLLSKFRISRQSNNLKRSYSSGFENCESRCCY